MSSKVPSLRHKPSELASISNHTFRMLGSHVTTTMYTRLRIMCPCCNKIADGEVIT
jgi:hypothetical protein